MEEAIGHKRGLSEGEKEKVVNDFLPFIKYTAYRLAWRLPPSLGVEDLISVGIVGLLDALTRYKESEGRVNTFVEYRIRGAMLDELRSSDWIPASMKKKISAVKNAYLEIEKELGRLPEAEEVAERLKMSVGDYYKILQTANAQVTVRFGDFSDESGDNSLDVAEIISDTSSRSPFELCEDNKNKEILARLISELPEKEKTLLSLYYWEELTMKEIAEVLSLTEGRVSQLHNQALLRLKAKMETMEKTN